MADFQGKFSPDPQLITWIESLLRDRIHPALDLNIDPQNSEWNLSLSSADGKITIAVIPLLYCLGNGLSLPCCKISTAHQKFFEAIEIDLLAPGWLRPLNPLVTESECGFHVEYDILGLTYWMLARCEEVNPPAECLDTLGRFPFTSSHAYRYDYIERPIVDEWLSVLRQLVQQLWPRLLLQKHHFCTFVSHDVDEPSAYAFGPRRMLLRRIAVRLLKHRELSSPINIPLIRFLSRYQLHPSDPFNTFNWLMDQSDAAGIQSAFYFICGRTDLLRDAQYKPEHPAIRALMRRIHERGHEIGLHPSYNSSLHTNVIASEGDRLKRIAREERIQQATWGGRMHYLRWRWPETAHAWELAGFDYDSTLGYADRPGFRCGTCHSFKMYDPLEQRQLQLIQRPLVVMEWSVIAVRYLGLGHSNEAVALIRKLQKRCRAVDGQFTLLWHNNRLTTQDAREMYANILKY